MAISMHNFVHGAEIFVWVDRYFVDLYDRNKKSNVSVLGEKPIRKTTNCDFGSIFQMTLRPTWSCSIALLDFHQSWKVSRFNYHKD